MSRKVTKSNLQCLVAALPEVYQPIYTHPELSRSVSRACRDRLEYIVQVYESLVAQLQRPLRVLDLGSAQGFFSFSLAELGASVHGVDYLDDNVAVCKELADEHKNLNVSFQVGRIEDVLQQLERGQYDLVLGLSVFHHIVQEKSAAAVGQMLSELAGNVEVGIFEFAQASEPLYWAEAQPEQPRQLLNGFAFVHELSRHETHLSSIARPLYFSSNHYWYLNARGGVFDSTQTYSNALAQGVHQGTRQYYFGNGLLVKQYRLDNAECLEGNLEEYHNEATFLTDPPSGFNVPELVLHGQHESEAWIVRALLPGELLLDVICHKKKYNPTQVLGDILTQLAVLEADGLYHNDVRVWNVLINADGAATLFDYGAISARANDCVWPNDIFLSFLIFVHEVTTGNVGSPVPLRATRISPFGLTEPYLKWTMAFWSRPVGEWNFSLLHELFMQRDTLSDSNTYSDTSTQLWVQTMEEALDGEISKTQHLESQLGRRSEQLADLESQLGRRSEQLADSEAALGTVSLELKSVYNSKSWYLTKPIRELKSFCKRLFALRNRTMLWLAHLSKRSVLWVLLKAMAYITKRSGLQIRAKTWLLKYPRLKTKLRRLLEQGLTTKRPSKTSYPDHHETKLFDRFKQSIHCQNTDASFVLPLPSGARNIYIYVDHTVLCSTNTGIQRVTRGVAASLRSLGENVHYVKWDAVEGQCVLINIEERRFLAEWNGPSVHETELKYYPSSDGEQISVAPHVLGENNWLIVPEVTHITYHEHPVTLNLLQWSRSAGLKTGFIFYDSIPLRRDELHEMSSRHAKYMRHLLLADVVWPISQWSADDLIAYWVRNECASMKTMPEIEVLHLSGESLLCERIREPKDGEKLILSVGSIEPRKNQVMLIRAFEAYRKLHPDSEWRLTLVGNIHPLVAEEVTRAQGADKAILHVGNVSNQKLDSLYRSCAFTVFPSVEEGFGLPILESLWYAKPCICANFGSMAEVAGDRGCYTVDTRDQAILEEAVIRLIDDEAFRHTLAVQAAARPMSSWIDYGAAIQARVEKEGHPEACLGRVYYWIDSTIQFPKNTGIQRVARQLACELIEMGVSLIPVKWDKSQSGLCSVTCDELTHFSKWNGPNEESWHDWSAPDTKRKLDWFILPDLPLNHSTAEQVQLLEYLHRVGLHSAAIFYDTIPWKMRDIYPPHFSQAHREYMIGLAEYDLIFPISFFSREDLIDFLGGLVLSCPQGIDKRIKSVVLPGEFPESPRVTTIVPSADGVITVLCVGTVEPRKNHETLLQAFELATQHCGEPLRLVIAGGKHSIEPELGKRVRAFIGNSPNVTWEEDVDDNRLRELQLACDFTVYPSIEEGFGLPILESLWYAKPSICANFGAMREAAEGGGCLMVDVSSVETLAGAIQRMVEDISLREALTIEAVERPFKTWNDYAVEVATRLAEATPVQFSELKLTQSEIESRAQSMNLVPRPKLSICISTYNRADWLATSLKNWSSLYPEPLPGVEFLVCDNASTDHTPEIVKPYLERMDFSYHRNVHNVGMLGNLRETTHRTRGEYVWILGDDDLLMPNAIERVMGILQSNLGVALVYLNYAFTRVEDARTLTDFDAFFRASTPIVPAEPDLEGPIYTICARNENFFTAIYALVFRRDHAIKAYSQDTSGRPFSTMLTCIPTTYYVLNYMMYEPGFWIGEPMVVVNMNVSWLRYAPLWILERIPEVYDFAEKQGVPKDQMDRWRSHTLPGVVNYFKIIFEDDPLNNAEYFRPDRVIRRFKHLPEFAAVSKELRDIYSYAHAKGHPAATKPVSVVFPENQEGHF